MLAPGEGDVVERQILEQLDVARKAHARVRAFDQVVTEQSFGGKTIFENGAKRVHVVNRFAVKHRLAEQVLLRVRYGLAIRVGARGVGEHAREACRRRARQRDADARLNDGKAAFPHACLRIDLHAV